MATKKITAKDGKYDAFKRILSDREGQVALFSHKIVDADSLGAMEGIRWLLKKEYNLECTSFQEGPISHPQNRATVESLDISLTKTSEYKSKDFALNILLDVIPCPKAGTGNNDISFDVVIDHHKVHPNGNFDGCYINIHAASTCATVYDIIKDHNLMVQDGNEEDSKVATALMAGVAIDTENLSSDDTTDYDFRANTELFFFRNKDAWKKIVNWEIPLSWMKMRNSASDSLSIEDGLAIAGMGIIGESQRDVIAWFADEVKKCRGVHTAIIFAAVESEEGLADRIEGSVRTNDSTLAVADFCKELGGRYGDGGGKTGKGAYWIPLNDFSIDADEEIKSKTWELINLKQINRIKKISKK